MALDWHTIVASMSWVQAMVHLAARYDSVDEERIRVDLLTMRRAAYNDELSVQAAAVGCPGQRGRLGNGDILSALNDASKKDAVSIANTFNYFLALEIIRAGQDNPRGNRYYYAKRIREWMPTYWAWKDLQIAQYTDQTARAMAQQDFYRFNGGMLGMAKLEPRPAVCPVCQGWIARGLVPLRVALNNPPPYHVNCLPPNAQINMPDGAMKPIAEIQKGEFVASRHGTTEVVQALRRYAREDLYRISVGGQVLQLTGDHPVLTSRGWILARELRADDLVALVNFRE